MNKAELIPTPLVYNNARKSVREGIVSLRHAKRDGIYLPVAPTSAMSLTLRSNFLGSNGQKQSVSDAFQNVVLPPSSRSSLLRGGSA